MAKYKLVIFDVDGTLLDTTEGVVNAVRYTIQKSGLEPLDEKQLLTFIGPPIQDSFRCLYGIEDVDKLQKLATVFRNRYKDFELLKARAYSGIYEVCDRLKEAGVWMAVATYKREDYAIDIMRHFGFAHYMQAIYGGDHENKLRKADIIQKCLNIIGEQNAGEAVMVGDTLNDSKGAYNAGIDFIGVTYGFGFRNANELTGNGCVGCVDRPIELLDIIL